MCNNTIYLLINVQFVAFQLWMQSLKTTIFLLLTYCCMKIFFEMSQDSLAISYFRTCFNSSKSISHPDDLQHRSICGWLWMILSLLIIIMIDKGDSSSPSSNIRFEKSTVVFAETIK